MKKSFRFKNILLILFLSFLVFVVGKIYFSNPDNLSKLEVIENSEGIISIEETK